MEIDKEYEECIEQLKQKHNTDELLSFNETNLVDKLANNSLLVMQYTELWHKEKNHLDKLIELRERGIGKLWVELRKKEPLLWKQGEFEKYFVPQDKDVIKYNELIRKQRYVVDFYVTIVKGLEKMQWNMKSFLSVKQQGL
jgi:hypothetical protein